jgi:hypothetical protein
MKVDYILGEMVKLILLKVDPHKEKAPKGKYKSDFREAKEFVI